jgi:hypothetical protein
MEEYKNYFLIYDEKKTFVIYNNEKERCSELSPISKIVIEKLDKYFANEFEVELIAREPFNKRISICTNSKEAVDKIEKSLNIIIEDSCPVTKLKNCPSNVSNNKN